MYLHTEQLINEIAVDEPDPAAANALQLILFSVLYREITCATEF